jgi:hypothetical protein
LAVSLAWVLTAGGAAAPLTATAVASPSQAALGSTESVTTTMTTTVTTGTPAPGVIPTTTAAPVEKKLSIPALITKIGSQSGLSKAEVAGLLWLAKRESNFHPTSESRSECHGLFQLSKSMAHGHPWKDPTWNTKRAIKYMRGRYGSVLSAKAFWSSHHWY